MKKSYIHHISYLLFIPLCILSLSFLFVSKVHADTKTLTYSDFSYVNNSNFSNMINYIDNTYTTAYFIIQRSDGVYFLYVTNSPSSSTYDCRFDGNFYLTCIASSDSSWSRYEIYSDYTISNSVISSGATTQLTFNLDRGSGYFKFIYSSIPINFVNGSNTFIITDNTHSYTCNSGDSCNQIAMYGFYDYFYSDETPLLTSFYEVTINRLVYICDYISTSYVFLAIFTIFILYFVILLIRRLR